MVLTPKVDVLLATYVEYSNRRGSEFLRQQLDSIFAQDFQDFRLLIRDDGSTHPDIFHIIDEYQRKYPGQIEVIEDDLGNLGYARNFEKLMEHSTAPYIAFCDQDDIWLPSKFSTCVSHMRNLEQNNTPQTPLMVHHEAIVIDEHGEVISDSLGQTFRNTYEEAPVNKTLYRTPAYGFTMFINQALKSKATPFFESVVGHDGHIGMVASAFGQIYFDENPLAMYRLHGENASNPIVIDTNDTVKKRGFIATLGALTRAFSKAVKLPSRLKSRFLYAKEFMDIYGDDPDLLPEHKDIIKDFIKIGSGWNPFERIDLINKRGFFKSDPIAKWVCVLVP